MFSIVLPIDTNRLEQFANTKRVYDAMPQKKEFLMPTRSYEKVKDYFEEHGLTKDVHLLPYEHKVGFNPAKALNMGVRNAKYNQIIISSPEVMPKTDVLGQLEKLIGENVLCQVWDEDEDGKVYASLVHRGYRDSDPGMYFLAMFNKSDIEKINGWDEEFMRGYAYEDNDFGHRWNRAGLPFVVHDEIQAVHQYHPRGETIRSGASINSHTLEYNDQNHVIRCKNGLKVL